jgi:large repetitive protein
MQTLSSQSGRGRGLITGFRLLVWLTVFGCLWPSLASAQHTSAECPAQTATVTSGGTVTINISDCEFVSGAGGDGDIDGGSFGPSDLEDHGTATTRHTGGQWFLDYSHNGSTGIGSTDVFELSDGSAAGNGDVRFTITINPSASPITVAPASLPTLTAGTPFSQTLSSSGGLAPYTYTLQSGVLPIGLSLTSAGVLSGTPTQRGAYSFSVRSTDSTSPTAQFVDKGYTGTVQNPSLAISPATATAIQSVPFSQTLAIAGGVAPHSCLLETGSFPAGISVSSACVISGTTTAAAGNYPVTIRVTDASTGPGSYFEVENFTLVVSPPPSVSIAVSPASVSEDGATNLTYTVTRSLNLSSPTVVGIAIGGTATNGTDYATIANTITIPGGATTATIVVNPNVDGTVEVVNRSS